MKIAFIVGTFPALSETFVLNQITGMLDRGHDVDIYARRKVEFQKMHSDVNSYKLLERTYYLRDLKIPRNKFIRVIKAIGIIFIGFKRNFGITIRTLNLFKYGKKALSFKLIYEIFPFLGNGPYDIIQCHYGLNGNLGACLKQLGLKGMLVTMFHGCDIRLGLEKGGDIYNQLFETGDCFLAISDYNYQNLIRFGADPEKIVSHPVGINIEKFPFRRQTVSVKNLNPLIIITVARLVKEKGIWYGISAIKRLLKEFPELHLEYHIAGGGELERQLRKQTEELDLVKTVKFLGPLKQEEVIRRMQNAHLFLLPSIAESLPIVLMEAQAVGLPIVATKVGSVDQAVIDGKAGFLVPKQDVRSLTKKLKYLIEHPELWAKMGLAGRKYVEEKYDINKLNNKLEKIYKRLINGNR